jgi:hypothetical protein
MPRRAFRRSRTCHQNLVKHAPHVVPAGKLVGDRGAQRDEGSERRNRSPHVPNLDGSAVVISLRYQGLGTIADVSEETDRKREPGRHHVTRRPERSSRIAAGE